MKISCERSKFAQAFQLVASVAAVRDVKPVLQNVKIKADKKGVLLQATDTEFGIRLVLDDCEVLEKGEGILPAKLLKNILSESPEEKLQINCDQEKTLVRGDSGSKFELSTQPSDEFPDVEDFAETSYHEIPAKVLREMIRRTLFATDTDNAKYALGGVFFELIDENASVVATDGRRLAYQSGTVKCVKDHKVETSIFPSKTLQLIERALNNDEEPVKIAVSANRALFQYNKMVFFTRLVEGRFPRWRNIIPETNDQTSIDILAGVFLSAIRQAAVVTSEKQPGVTFVFDSGKLILQGHGSEIGESFIETPISYSGPKKQLKLDPRFMTEYLRVLESEKNLALYITENDPLTIKTDDNYTYVVMPLS